MVRRDTSSMAKLDATAPDPDQPRGWVADRAERATMDGRFARLVGRRIEGVRYFELRYEGEPGPMWGIGSSFDSLDFGLEFDLDDGSTWSCIWERPEPDALIVYEGPLRPMMFAGREDPRVWDVGERWRAHGPGTIVGIETAWLGPRPLCLETVILTGQGDGVAVITLGESDRNGRFTLSATNVAVFFSVEDARAAGAVLPGDPRAGT